MNECLSPKVALAVFSLQDEENWQSFFLSSNFWFLPCSNPEISRFLMLEERLYDRHKPPGETILAWGIQLGRTGEKEQDACITV